ncbi:hypothetical protein FB567DRAFT_339061 [Paraphoma chrysanthemicola]|uniref:Heterokaryon incompatibility domain-containing protein n=1 Tax=Paraphoma chrysanthemicola TaxID=798071 RepID=A0A8K0W0A9_9PLEO|nr:hypothetical protein FB567DRAFT_339061 [Paraphoma chrysanthemicola]
MSLAYLNPTFVHRAARPRVRPEARSPKSRPGTPSVSHTYPKSLPQSSIGIPEQAFTHAPIDLQNNSIRLLEVLPADPKDPNGIIQCRIRHDTTAAVYTCLSYVWGVEDPLRKRMVLINGKSF